MGPWALIRTALHEAGEDGLALGQIVGSTRACRGRVVELLSAGLRRGWVLRTVRGHYTLTAAYYVTRDARINSNKLSQNVF